MSADSVLATAAGVGAASVAIVYDQGLAMATTGGMFMFLAISVAIPLQSRFFFAIGSAIFGYLIGMLCMSFGNLSPFAAIFAFAASSLGSAIVGSLHKWGNGGPTPKWVLLLSKLIPFGWKKGGGSE